MRQIDLYLEIGDELPTRADLKTLRHHGLLKSEFEELKRFCLSDDYPRVLTLTRTGTKYVLGNEKAARRLWTHLLGKKKLVDYSAGVGDSPTKFYPKFHNMED